MKSDRELSHRQRNDHRGSHDRCTLRPIEWIALKTTADPTKCVIMPQPVPQVLCERRILVQIRCECPLAILCKIRRMDLV